MKSFILFILVILLCNSCSSFKSHTSPCDKEVKSSLKSISRYISIDKNSKVYTVQYSKLPKIEKDRFEKLRDSLYYIIHFEADYNLIQHYLYSKQLENIPNINCEITVDDIRNYLGLESMIGLRNGKISDLFYYFNNPHSMDCYDTNDNNGFYRKCSLLTFNFDTNQILTKVYTGSFSY